jgi:hypothetical protein
LSARPRIAFSTLAFPDVTLTLAASLGRRWGYAGIEAYGLLRPYLVYRQAGRYGGFSGPAGFTRAAQALKLILNELAISWR